MSTSSNIVATDEEAKPAVTRPKWGFCTAVRSTPYSMFIEAGQVQKRQSDKTSKHCRKFMTPEKRADITKTICHHHLSLHY